jgi:hypoxanthine phosphoribosyltransferase
MSEQIINRADNKIDSKDFLKLTQLHLEYEWLTYEPEALFDLWCLSDNAEQKDLIEHLIKNFSFIDSRKLTLGGENLSNQIETIWELTPSNTFLLATCDDRKPDGSQSIIQILKNKFSINWKESNFYNSLPIGANEISSNSNILLVDDFIGTGDTIERKLKYLNSTIKKRKLENVTIRIISLAAMDFSKDVLNALGVEYYSVHWLKKGINELIEEAKREAASQSMEQLEGKLKKKYHGKQLPKFGYKGSEALYALEANNIPNNVFPIFWWPFYKGGNSRKTLFRRI